ncbi:tRNA (guanosine(46)-N7)-methyltransferase TrmB [Ideonella dechloratans]|uniref:tRNA (guanine-N(7)-)-methyltransferase n=1 Tax=Ideonella dechloratans TaxID=36863 RepID=A0A643FD50_IDEDE|nr:tRNA (guanosine(46)-N7)-methyltransferase TrmB [Ideonella dechloratans]KAB0579515.1 tRNA (guanosine(46)-N7)-methyltransferase TrmB [Ideonella dechloratans]UFU11625.1 tRNA (guanosine(46)-N7)-methyltransferase TrmB [Ideonella dechloratans]
MTHDTPLPEEAPTDDDLSAAGGEAAGAPHRRIRSFVLRAGRMGTGQQRALEELGPQYLVPYAAQPLDAVGLFGRDAPLIVEIGFGMGHATAQIAAARRDTDFLGIEVHTPGVGALLKRIGEEGLSNLRIVQHDAVEVLEHMIAPDSLAGVHVFFPDPWHKKKHNKRRLIQPPFVALLASRLKPGGILHCATDWQPYAEQMLEVLGGEPRLRNTAAGYAPRPDYRPLTKFENRGIRLGHGVWDLVFERQTIA